MFKEILNDAPSMILDWGKRVIALEVKASLIGIFFLLLFIFLLSSYGVRKSPESFGLLKGPEILREEEDNLIAEVSRIIEVPSDERPTVATVSDPEQLTSQSFFQNTVVGDKILVYSAARKAILYRPSENRVVEVGSLNIESDQVAGLTDDSEEEIPLRFIILNGTETPGLAKIIEDQVLQEIPDADIVRRGNAVAFYDQSIIIDIAGDHNDTARDLARSIGVEVASLPQEEQRPSDADFMFIAGADLAPEPEATPSEEPTP